MTEDREHEVLTKVAQLKVALTNVIAPRIEVKRELSIHQVGIEQQMTETVFCLNLVPPSGKAPFCVLYDRALESRGTARAWGVVAFLNLIVPLLDVLKFRYIEAFHVVGETHSVIRFFVNETWFKCFLHEEDCQMVLNGLVDEDLVVRRWIDHLSHDIRMHVFGSMYQVAFKKAFEVDDETEETPANG